MTIKAVKCEWCGRNAVSGDILCKNCIRMDLFTLVDASRRSNVIQTETGSIVGSELVGDSILRACIGPETLSAKPQVGDVGGTVGHAGNDADGGVRVVRKEFAFIPAMSLSWPRGVEIEA